MSGEEVKPGYKRTEVGVIPEDWEAVKLGDLFTVVGGGAFKSTDATKHGTRWLKIANVGINKILWSDESYLPNFFQSKHKCFLLKKGDFVLALTRPILDGKLKIAQIKSDDEPSLLNQRVGRIDVLGGNDSEYIYHILQTESHVRAMLQSMAGTDPPNLSSRGISSILCATPRNFHEQHSIATALSDVDALLAKLDQLISKKRDLKQATMQQLLTGQTRLPGFSGEWEMKRLGGMLAYLGNGAVYKPASSFGFPVTRIETIADGAIDFSRVGYAVPTDELKKYRLKKGDILFSHINSIDHIGKVAIYESETALYHGMNLLLLRPSEAVLSRYLFYWLGSRQGRKQSATLAKQAVSQASINTVELKGLELLLPAVDEQTAIAAVLYDSDAELATLEARRDKTHEIKKGMMQELLTGKVRLQLSEGMGNE
jgi:type I restriction enzyme S subunit